MDQIITDWKFWGFILTALGLLVNWLASQKIANNHLKHMDEKLDKIDVKLDSFENKLVKHEIEIEILKNKV